MGCNFCLSRDTCKRNKSNASYCRRYELDEIAFQKYTESVKEKMSKKKTEISPAFLAWCRFVGIDTSSMIEEEPTLPIKLKDYPARNIYAWGYDGLRIRYNNDTENLDLNTLKENPNLEKILNSNIISQREFFGTKVLVIDYVE